MNLYRLIVLHAGPKSSMTATHGFFVAATDEEVFQSLSYEAGWDYKIKDWETDSTEDDRGPNPKEEILANCGDLDNEEGWDDAYYGVRKYGWSNLGPITEDQINTLRELKIL